MSKHKPNPYSLFAYEYKSRHKCKSTREAFEKAGPIWQKMSKEERLPYVNQAKPFKNSGEKYTCDGIKVADLQRMEELKMIAKEKERQEVKDMILFAYGRGPNVLARKNFFLIHCNVFCYHQERNRYWPTEIAVISFNLMDGVQDENIYHSMVEPGPLPMGYRLESQKHSDATHRIELPEDDDPIDNQVKIYFDLKAFLEKHGQDSQKNPILFTREANIFTVKTILNTWSYDFDDEQCLFQVYSLENMFHNLRNTVAEDVVWPTITFPHRELDRDTYSYADNIACAYHLDTACQYCSRSIVVRRAFVLCDNCCVDLNIEFVPGKHVPSYCDVSDVNKGIAAKKGHKSFDLSKKLQQTAIDSDEENLDYTDTESVASSCAGTAANRKKRYQYDSDQVSIAESSVSTYGSKTAQGRGFKPRNDSLSSQPGSSRYSDDFPALGSSSTKGRGRGRGIPLKTSRN